MLDQLLGSLDHLCFAFPQALGMESQSYSDPSVFIAGAIARTRNPPVGAIRARVGPRHPLPWTYIRLDGISRVEVLVPTNSAKKLLKRKRCLVIETWGEDFVCRVPNDIRDGIDRRTIAIIGIPLEGYDWNLPIIEKMQEVARALRARCWRAGMERVTVSGDASAPTTTRSGPYAAGYAICWDSDPTSESRQEQRSNCGSASPPMKPSA